VSAPPIIFAKGDAVKITAGGRTVRGHVIMASPNGKSLFLDFDAMLHPDSELGGYVGMMPVSWNEEHASFEDLIKGGTIGIEHA
jgi:hypothetical protein